jgi:peptidoglycan-associated lipoprotein
MKSARILIALLLSLTLLNGCFFKKKQADDSGAYYGTDTPLEEFPLDSFYEPVGSDALILRNILFDYNSYDIKPEERSTLLGIADWMRENKTAHLLIEGHCDERGSNEYNLALGEQRALSARQFLVDQGIDAYRLQTISYGEERPIDPGHDEGAWRQNRRCHFLIANE